MIPRGRKVITFAEVAALGAERSAEPVSPQTWRRREGDRFKQHVENVFAGRYLIYDLEQALAHLDGKRIPALPVGEHPDDLLNDREVAALLGLAVSTVQAYRSQGYLPGGTHPKDPDGEDITSIRVTPRREVEARRNSLPEGHAAGQAGRPVGSAAREEAEELLRSGQARTGKDIAAALGISRRYGGRLLRDAGAPAPGSVRQERQERVRDLLEQPGPTPTLQQIADELGVSKTAAHRLVQALRAARENQQMMPELPPATNGGQ